MEIWRLGGNVVCVNGDMETGWKVLVEAWMEIWRLSRNVNGDVGVSM